MSGTNQSKVMRKQDEMNQERTNNLGTCTSSKQPDSDVRAENSHTKNEKLQRETEGNLHLQIQEAIAATIRKIENQDSLVKAGPSNSVATSHSLSSVGVINIDKSEVKVADENSSQVCNAFGPPVSIHDESDVNVDAGTQREIQNTHETNLQIQDSVETSNSDVLSSLVQNKNLCEESEKANDFKECIANSNISVINVANQKEVQGEDQAEEPDEALKTEKLMRPKEVDNLNKCISSSQDKVGVGVNESLSKVGDRIEEKLQSQEVIEDCVSSHGEVDLNIANVETTTKIREPEEETSQSGETIADYNSQENMDLLAGTEQIRNNENDGIGINIENAETTVTIQEVVEETRQTEEANSKTFLDLQVDADQVSHSKGIENSEKELQDTVETQEAFDGKMCDENLPLDTEQTKSSSDSISNDHNLININISNTEKRHSEVSLNIENAETTKEIEEPLEETSQTEETTENSNSEKNVDLLADTDQISHSKSDSIREGVEETPQTEEVIGHANSEMLMDIQVDADQVSDSKSEGIENSEREVQDTVETSETQAVGDSESKMFDKDLPLHTEQTRSSTDHICDDHNVNNISISNTEKTESEVNLDIGNAENTTKEFQKADEKTSETEENIADSSSNKNMDLLVDTDQISCKSDGIAISIQNTETTKTIQEVVEETPQTEETVGDSNSETLMDLQVGTDSKGTSTENNERDVQDTVETLETREAVDDSDSKMFDKDLPSDTERTKSSSDCINNDDNVNNIGNSNTKRTESGLSEVNLNTENVETTKEIEKPVEETSRPEETIEDSNSKENMDLLADTDQAMNDSKSDGIKIDIENAETRKIQKVVKDTQQMEDSVGEISHSKEDGVENTEKGGVQDAVETLERQDAVDVPDSKMFNENLPMDTEQIRSSSDSISDGDNVNNIGISNREKTESSKEVPQTSEKYLEAQEAAKTTNCEVSSNKDLLIGVEQTNQLDDTENQVNINVKNSKKDEENLDAQDADANTESAVSAEPKETPNVVVAKSQEENLNRAISKMQSEDVIPVIEIVEEENDVQEVVEVIDVEASDVLKRTTQRNRIRKKLSRSKQSGGVCIEILSDEDEAQVQQKVQKSSEVQQPAEVDSVEITKNQMEDILHQVKMLTSTEYLLFYLKLPPKSDAKISEQLSDTLRSKLENNEIIIPDKNKNILKTMEGSIKETSQNTVQNIVDRVQDLTVKEYLWLHSNLPTDCINPNLPTDYVNSNLQHCLILNLDTNQSVLWIKTHIEENPEQILLKQEVYERYGALFTHNNMHPLSTMRFGKLIKQVCPNIGQKRLRAKGTSRYYYTGVQWRVKLDSPRLPKLSEKLRRPLTSKNESLNCMNESENSSSGNQLDGKINKIIVSQIPQTAENENLKCENKSEDSYSSRELDGKTILVHDPFALLSMSTNDGGSSNKQQDDTPSHQSYEDIASEPESDPLDENLQISKNRSQLHHHKVAQYPPSRSRSSTSVTNNGVLKVKFKEYKHPSVQRVYKKFNTIILPREIYKLNINPSVVLGNKEMNSWYAERIEKFTQKLSNIIISKIERSQNFNVTFTCCDDVFEVSESYAKQLRELKENLANVAVRRFDGSSNYEVVRISQKNVLVEQLHDIAPLHNDSFRITKQLTNREIKLENEEVKFSASKSSTASSVNTSHNKHPSLRKLYKKFKNVVLPEEVFNSDIDPVIILDSGEVIEWYVKQLDNLKKKLSPKDEVKDSVSDLELHNTSSRQSSSSSRQSRAKMMNFCESDSSDNDGGNINVPEYRSFGYITTNNDVLQTSVENTMVATPSSCGGINVSEISHEIDSQPMLICTKTQNEDVQQPCTGQKRLRLSDEEINEIEQKRRRFYCSKITLSLNQNADLSVQSSSDNTGQILHFKEKSPEKCRLPVEDNVESFGCSFCTLVFDQKKQLTDHKRIHTYCRSCKRRFKNLEVMHQHLINHCSLNTRKNKPFLKLWRVDSIPSIVEKYARAFREPVLDVTENSDVSKTANRMQMVRKILNKKSKFQSGPKNVLCSKGNEVLSTTSNNNLGSESMDANTSNINLKCSDRRTYSKLPRCTTLRIVKASSDASTPNVSITNTAVSVENQDNVYHQTQQEPTFQLKSTISNNLNKILLLSNNASQSQSPNILYGTLFVNNASGQSSSNICLSSSNNLYNPTVTTVTSGVDCAMNVNPSCSNPDLQQPPTFMQIVEAPNTPMVQYAAPVSQSTSTVTFEHHQDHSYHQQQQQQQQQFFQIGNNVSNINNIVFLSNNVPQNTTTEFLPFFDQPVNASETETTNYVLNSQESSTVSNPPPQGQFKIRVKSIQELR